MEINKIYCGDALEILKTFPNESVNCVVTSPPYYGIRDYGCTGQYGLEKTPEEYVEKMMIVFKEVRRTLKKEGTMFLNLGDTYGGSGNGSWNVKNPKHFGKQFYKKTKPSAYLAIPRKDSGVKPKDMCGIPWRTAFALQADGWYLRQDIIWAKPNPMPESVNDRCTKSHEYIFLLSKSPQYYYDNVSIMEPSINDESYTGRRKRNPISMTRYDPKNVAIHPEKMFGKKYEMKNKRSVWTVPTHPYKGSHFATFPQKLVIPMITAGCKLSGIVLDPFCGAGTTCLVAKKLNRNYVGIELNEKYCKIAEDRILEDCGNLF